MSIKFIGFWLEIFISQIILNSRKNFEQKKKLLISFSLNVNNFVLRFKDSIKKGIHYELFYLNKVEMINSQMKY